MDVKFINPFLYGTAEVIEKMAFLKPLAGKPFAKTDDTARGDVSGIIGMTGDATGSLAMSFSEACIIGIVIPFKTKVIDLVIDVCLRSNIKQKAEKDNFAFRC